MLLRNDLQKLALFSSSSKSAQQTQNNVEAEVKSEWKKNVVVVPIQTTPEDLKRNHKLVGDGFYVSHRIYVEKMPEKYTTEPFKTRRTGGYDIETRKI